MVIIRLNDERIIMLNLKGICYINNMFNTMLFSLCRSSQPLPRE